MESREDPNFGSVNLYHFPAPPYEYLVELRRNFVEDMAKAQAEKAHMEQLQQLEHANIAKIYGTDLKEEKQLCIINQTLRVFCTYYNATLQRAMEIKRANHQHFTEAELMYIVGALACAGHYLKEHQVVFGEFRTESVYLSPEGHAKVYLTGVAQDNSHDCYYRVAGERTQLMNYNLAPEQLDSIQRMDY